MLDPLLPARVLAALRVSRLLARLLPARLRPALSRLLGRVLSVLLVRGRRLGPTGLRAVLRLPALLLGGTAVRTEAAVHRALRLSGLFGAGAIVLRRAPRLRRRLRPGPRRGLGPGLRIRAGFARCDGRAHTCRAAAAPGGTVRSATRGRGRGVRESARNLGRRGVAALPVRERAVVLIPVPSAVAGRLIRILGMVVLTHRSSFRASAVESPVSEMGRSMRNVAPPPEVSWTEIVPW